MKRKLSCVLLTLVVILSLCFSVSAEAPYVVDQADLLSPEQEQELAAKAKAFADDYDFGIYLVLVDDFEPLMGLDNVEDTTREYYLENGYGVGEGQHGMILLLSMNERDFSLYTNQDDTNTFDSSGREYLRDQFLPALGENDWYTAFQNYFSVADQMMEASLNGERLQDGNFRLWGILGCMVIALVLTVIFMFYLSSQLTSVAKKTEATGFISPEGLDLSYRADTFTHRTQTRVYDPPKESSSSSESSSGSTSGKF